MTMMSQRSWIPRASHSCQARRGRHWAPAQSRRGVALIGALVTLTILSLLISAIGWQIAAHRRAVDHRQYALQATWLARAGVEHAAAKLLQGADGYHGETLALLPLSVVRIEVSSTDQDVFQISCDARYPTEVGDPVRRSITRQFRRAVDGEQVRLEPVSR